MKFSESGMEFNFGPGWAVRKYDDVPYFKRMGGKGLKGVDFIAIRQNRELIFIEVKNYQTRYNPSMDRTFEVSAKPADELAYELKGKFEDTLTAMDAVRQYFHRSWWYRRLRNLWLRWPWLHHDRAFWSRANVLVDHHLHYVAWLALDLDDPDNYEEELLSYLEAMKLEMADQISIANGRHSPFGGEVKVG